MGVTAFRALYAVAALPGLALIVASLALPLDGKRRMNADRMHLAPESLKLRPRIISVKREENKDAYENVQM